MDSLATNGVTFSPQAISETPKILKGSSSSKLGIFYKPPNSKSHNSRFLELRAAVDDAKSIQSDLDYDPNPILGIFRDYYNSKYGSSQKMYSFTIPKGLCEETIRLISSRKEEPDWMLEFRLNSYHKLCQMTEPKSEPKKKPTENSNDEEPINYFIPLNQKKPLKKSDTASIAITHLHEALKKSGVIFCSISEAIKRHPELVKTYLGKAVSTDDNFYAALNSAVFSDGSFVYIPKDTKCPMELSTYYRTNTKETTRRFERTLIIADDRSFVDYLENCSTPWYDKNQLHAAVVELLCNEQAEIKYSTFQKWYPGDKNGLGEIYNFVTKRGLRAGRKSKISWTQVEGCPAVTCKYPNVVLEGDDSVGEFYSD